MALETFFSTSDDSPEGITESIFFEKETPIELAGEVVVVFPDLNIIFPSLCDYMNAFGRMANLQMRLNCISQNGNYEYTICGIQEESLLLPMFPVGELVEWKFTSLWNPKTRMHEICFDLPSRDSAMAGHYKGLAQCFQMLISTAGGSLLLQRALEANTCHQENKELLLDAMHGRVWKLALLPYGNQFVKKCIELFSPKKLQGIVDSLKSFVAEASCDRMQSRILEWLFQHCPPHQMFLPFEEVLISARKLMTDRFGNYVVLSILYYGSERQKKLIVVEICLDMSRLCRNKIGSKLICNALMSCGAEANRMLLIKAIGFEKDLHTHKTGLLIIKTMQFILQSA